MVARGRSRRTARLTSATTGCAEVDPEWPKRTASGLQPATSAAIASAQYVVLRPASRSASSSRTSWPSSISGPPTESSPSGGRWSSGMRLPIDGWGTLIRSTLMASPDGGEGAGAQFLRPPPPIRREGGTRGPSRVPPLHEAGGEGLEHEGRHQTEE